MSEFDPQKYPLSALLEPRGRGRPGIAEQHPEVLVTVERAITQSCSGAHDRRRDETQIGNGISLAELTAKIADNHPEVGKVALSTVHRWMVAPNQQHKAAARYKGAINAKIPAKKNNKTTPNSDFQYSAAQVNLTQELMSLYEEECLIFSCDNKNKVPVGTLASDRRLKHTRFHSVDRAPDYNDHDFPFPSSKLVPQGYANLVSRKSRSRSVESPRSAMDSERNLRLPRSQSLPPRGTNQRKDGQKWRYDKLGRKHISWPRSGELFVNLHAEMFHHATSATHVNDLLDILKPMIRESGKGVVSMMCDNGPDWAPKYLINIINMGRLWRDLRLSALFVSPYAANHSKYNPIERFWAYLTNFLIGGF